MNIEICKKCNNDTCFLYFFKDGICHQISSKFADYLFLLHSNEAYVHMPKKETAGRWNCIKTKTNSDIQQKKVNKVELDRNCPYYAEHELYDWNKKK